MRRSIIACAVLAPASLLLACSAVLGIHEVKPPDEDGGTGADGSSTSDASDAKDSSVPKEASPQIDGPAPDAPADACASSECDPNNCGAVGHACNFGVHCVGGYCGDGGAGASCIPAQTQTLPRAGGPACPTETSTCYPHDLTAWMPQWAPPFGPHAGSCSTQQISGYYDACRGPSQTQAQCSAFGVDPNNATCIACMETTVGAAHWGPVIIDGQQNWVSVAGCIALAEPCNLPCAEALTAIANCYTDACWPACMGSPYSDLVLCEQNSATQCTTCSQFLTGAGCFTQLTGTAHPAAALCGMSQPGTKVQFQAVAQMICGT